MSKMQRRKGYLGENEIVNLLKDEGLTAKRIAQMETNAKDKGDIALGKEIGQVKRGQHVPIFLYKSLKNADYLFCRRNNEDWLVTMNLQTFLSLYTLSHLTH